MGKADSSTDIGIQFPKIEGVRSSQRSGRNILSGAVRFVDADLADRIESTSSWRKRYIEPTRDVVAAGLRSPKDTMRLASDGLAQLYSTMTYETDGGSSSIADAFGTAGVLPETVTIEGNGAPVRYLQIPYRGQMLEGDSLLIQLDDWVDRGVIEPSSRERVAAVAANPGWLDMSDLHVALLGAASEMGPYRALVSWGANVYAVDLPRPRLWEEIISIAREGAGRVHIPAPQGTTSDSVTADAGYDLLRDAPKVRDWLAGRDAPMIVGNYVYADGNTFVRLATAVDAITVDLIDKGVAVGMSYLATPTDVFAVPSEVVTDSRRRLKSRGVLARTGALISRKAVFAPNYREEIESEDGSKWGIYDCLVPQQGPNYAIAKNVQRWRAMVCNDGGVTTSANVAPPTRTRSVTKNRVLAAAYSGAGAFGVEIFEPATSRALCAALLAYDLRNGRTTTEHPYRLFTDGAVHGGLWRNPHAPRSVLPMAVLLGLPSPKTWAAR
jgi:hypothetical protein